MIIVKKTGYLKYKNLKSTRNKSKINEKNIT